MTIKTFVFSPFQVNTYLLFDETHECLIVDPGCYDDDEEKELANFLFSHNLKPVLLVNTHLHIDHILGNNFLFRKFGLKPKAHEAGLFHLINAPVYARTFGMHLEEQIVPETFIKGGDMIRFGNSELEVLYTPGHVDGSVSLYCKKEGFVLSGDVLFYESIGRTDLPTGNMHILLESIQQSLFTLPEEVVVYSGHGHETTIGHEQRYNPFVNDLY